MYYYIVNPAAGSRTIDSIQDRLKSTLRELKIDGEFAKTLGPGDAAKITANALSKGARTLVAVGGSETVNEIINTVYKHQQSDVAVGIIPIGKNNTLARALGISNWRQACEILAGRRLVEYSLIAANDNVLVQSLVIEPIAPPETEEETESQPDSWWQKIMRPQSAPAELVIHFKAELDKKLKLRGEATKLAFYNQKFLYPGLENELLIQIYDTYHHSHSPLTKVGMLIANRMPSAHSSQTSGVFSQLHGSDFKLKTQDLTQASLDGKPLTARQYDITLTDWKLRLITNLPR